MQMERRKFLETLGAGLAVISAAEILRLGPTPASGDELPAWGNFEKAPAFHPTAKNILGPFFREGSPFRAKVTPPLAKGTVLLISGRVWGHDTGAPLPHAVIDVWHADDDGRYDNDNPETPPGKGAFKNRARVVTDSLGYYEYEAIHPGRYQTSPGVWRPSHVHYYIRHPGYKDLITQLYFRGDPHNAKDPFIVESLIIDVEKVAVGSSFYERGRFDIVLEPK